MVQAAAAIVIVEGHDQRLNRHAVPTTNTTNLASEFNDLCTKFMT